MKTDATIEWGKPALVAMALGALIAALFVHTPSAGAADESDRLVFTRWNGSGGNVFAVDVDGSNLTDLGPGWGPKWSRDGSLIVFAAVSVDGTEDIFVMDPDGSNRRRLHASSANDVHPNWSPDGRTIAFLRKKPGGKEPGEGGYDSLRVWLMDADGSNDRYVKTDNSSRYHVHPSWSPDARSLVFESRGDGRQLQILNLASGNQRSYRLGDISWWPTWAPSDRITFSSQRFGVGNDELSSLWSANPDGGEPTRHTGTDEDDFSASWSEDGAMLAFARDPDGGPVYNYGLDYEVGPLGSAIHVMNADGSGMRVLTSPPQGFSDWGPRFRPSGTLAPAISGSEDPAEAPQQQEAPPGAAASPVEGQTPDDEVGSASLSDRSEGQAVADRAPTAEGVGIADDPHAAADQPNDAASIDAWAAIVAGIAIAGALFLMGLGRAKRFRSRS